MNEPLLIFSYYFLSSFLLKKAIKTAFFPFEQCNVMLGILLFYVLQVRQKGVTFFS